MIIDSRFHENAKGLISFIRPILVRPEVKKLLKPIDLIMSTDTDNNRFFFINQVC